MGYAQPGLSDRRTSSHQATVAAGAASSTDLTELHSHVKNAPSGSLCYVKATTWSLSWLDASGVANALGDTAGIIGTFFEVPFSMKTLVANVGLDVTLFYHPTNKVG